MKCAIICFIALVGAILMFTGCTAFGTYAGWRADRANAKRDIHASPLDFHSIPSGYPVEVTLKDGRTWSGRYAGEVMVPEAVYAARYDSTRRALAAQATLPPLNELLLATKKTGQEIHVRFAGFHPDGMAIRATYSPPWIRLALDSLDTLSDISGASYSPGVLQDLLMQNQLPLLTAVRLRWNGSAVTVPLEEIEEIHAGPQRTSNWAFGLGLGIIVDALAGSALWRSIEKSK